MLLIRIYKNILRAVTVLAIYSLFTAHSCIFAEISQNFRASLASFMSEIPMMSSKYVREKLTEGLEFPASDYNANIYAVSYVKYGGSVYSLVVVKIPEDSDIDVTSELEISSQERALIEAQSRLAFYLGQSGADRKLFRYDDALGSALLNYYQISIKTNKLRGIETVAGVLDGVKFAAGIARLSSSTADILASDIPSPGTLDDDYCRFLYRRRALLLFKAGRYEEALPVFRNIHDFRWSDVSAYLDASECFLRTGKNDDCTKLLKELIATLEDKMSSIDFRRSGNLFRQAGDRESARDSFQRARKRYHDENKKGIQLYALPDDNYGYIQ